MTDSTCAADSNVEPTEQPTIAAEEVELEVKPTSATTTVVPPLPGRAGSTLEIAESLGIATIDPVTGEPVSRNALKKRIREAREQVIAPLWRERRKQIKLARRERQRTLNDNDGDDNDNSDNKHRDTIRHSTGRRSHPRPPDDAMPPIDITLVLDCAYDDLMTDKELHSLALQISRCYSAQKVAKCAAAGGLVLTDYSERLAAQMNQVSPNAHRWQRYRQEATSYTTLFPADQLVYLSADADTVLKTLEPGTAYVIGGLVDRNHHKNLTHQRATGLGVRTARLPIGDYIATSHRRVLTVNHVVEILTEWCGCRDWKQAFLKVIPQRKLTSPTTTTTTELSENVTEDCI
ncbi:guanine-1-methyltransferase-domain-containing protein [Syncephalis fuscata]|nr:guanine-1-methyltransferase-domain-containing protein [Syncephalis fuscata]